MKNNVKEHRKSLGLTQEKLSREMGLTQSYISKIERGEKNPSLETAMALSEFLGTGIHDLFASKG